jgi:bile acid-coenzyme A ligase
VTGATGSALPPGTISYGRRLAELAALHPERTAIVFVDDAGREQSMTWRELDEGSTAAAHLLVAAAGGEMATGDRVGIALPSGPEHFIATYAAWKLGACPVPMRWDLPEWERTRLLAMARLVALIGDWPTGERGVPVLTAAQLRAAPRDPAAAALPDRIAFPVRAIASGGSTGAPKLIVTPLPGAAVPGRYFETGALYPGNAPGETQLIPAPLYHTNGFAVSHNGLFEDQTLIVLARFDAGLALDLIERHRISVMCLAPTMLLRMWRTLSAKRFDLTSIKGVLQGAASCPPWLVRAWIDRLGPEKFFIAYGGSENPGLTMITGSEWLEHPGSVGKGFFSEIRILDEQGHELAAGEVGEIYLRSQVSQGPTYEYVGASPARATPDGFVSLGDLGWVDADGYLYVADRRVDLIVTGGANVFPAEVEAALTEHPAVGDVAVIGLPDEEWGHRVHAVVAAQPETAVTADELIEHCRRRLAGYKVPKSVELVEHLPRNEAGKVNRRALVDERVAATGPSA